MIIRESRETDSPEIGRQLSTTYRTYNLSQAEHEEQARLLGPSKHAFFDHPKHQEAVENCYSPMALCLGVLYLK